MTLARKFLFFLGIALLLGFLATGQYLEHSIRPGLGEDLAHRMMARANHLYILFISLLIMVSSLVETPRLAWIARLMTLGRILFIASAVLLIIGFFTDHSGATKDRVATLYGCIAALTGGLLIGTKAFAKD